MGQRPGNRDTNKLSEWLATADFWKEPTMNGRRRTAKVCLVAATALTGLALSACSSPAEPEATSGSTAPIKVKVLFASAINNTAMMVAAENGYWREQGLDVSVQVLDSGGEIATAVMSGAADIGAGNATSSIPLARASGNDLTLVGPYHNNPLVVSGAEHVGILAAGDSGIREGDAKSLIGKSVGVTVGTTPENYLKAYLAANDMSMDDIKPVNLAVPDMATALSQGTVDAVVPWEPQVSQILRTQDDVTTVVRGGAYGRTVVGVMVTDEYFAEHPDIIEKYVVGAWQGDQFVREHPEEAAVMAQRYISGLNVEDATSALERMTSDFDPRISPCTEESVTREQQALIDAGSLDAPKPLAYTQIVQADFINELISRHEELFSDLESLPASAADCG